MKQVTLAEAEYVAYSLVKEMMDYGEPMGDFSTRFPNKLESCLSQPFSTFDGAELYPLLLDKAAVLFYLVIKNHPFANGNKRMAVMLMFYFLFKNNKFLDIHPDTLYETALMVADSTKPMEHQLQVLKRVLKDHLVERQTK